MRAAMILLCVWVVAVAAEVPQRRPVLGITLDVAASSFEAGQGLVVATVERGSNAERFGLRPGDRIREANEELLTSVDDLGRVMAAVRPGDRLLLGLEREGQELRLGGELQMPLAAREVLGAAQAMAERLEVMQRQPAVRERYSLHDLLVILRQIEEDLPRAAREFREVYPAGRFRISISIDVSSDGLNDAAAPPEVLNGDAGPLEEDDDDADEDDEEADDPQP